MTTTNYANNSNSSHSIFVRNQLNKIVKEQKKKTKIKFRGHKKSSKN